MKYLILLCMLHLALPTLANGQELNQLSRDFESRLEYIGVAVEEPDYHVWGTSPVIGPQRKNPPVRITLAGQTWLWWLDDSLRDRTLRWGPPRGTV